MGLADLPIGLAGRRARSKFDVLMSLPGSVAEKILGISVGIGLPALPYLALLSMLLVLGAGFADILWLVFGAIVLWVSMCSLRVFVGIKCREPLTVMRLANILTVALTVFPPVCYPLHLVLEWPRTLLLAIPTVAASYLMTYGYSDYVLASIVSLAGWLLVLLASHGRVHRGIVLVKIHRYMVSLDTLGSWSFCRWAKLIASLPMFSVRRGRRVTVAIVVPRRLYEEAKRRGIDVEEMVISVLMEKLQLDPVARAGVHIELAEKYLSEASEYLERGDGVQASEKLYKVAEECIKALAELLGVPEAEKARNLGRWFTWLLDKACRRATVLLGEPRIKHAWDAAYSLHVRGFHEAKLDVDDVRLDLPHIKWLLEFAKQLVGRKRFETRSSA